MNKNTLLALIIILLSAALVVLLIFAIKGETARRTPSAAQSEQELSGGSESRSEISNDGRAEFPSEITILNLYVPDLGQTEASDFVAASDGIDYAVEFSKAPDLAVTGWQDIVLRFEYRGNLFQRSARAYVFHMENEIKYELSRSGSVKISDYVADPEVAASFADGSDQALSLSVEGKRNVSIDINGKLYPVVIDVSDTVPPTASPVGQTVALGSTLDASAFVSDINDVSAVSCSFETAPRWGVLGTHNVTVLLTDQYGNVGKCVSSLTVQEVVTRPVFKGLSPITICVGDTISYRSGVSCTDTEGNNVTYTIDVSKVDRNRPGTYEAIYTATDAKGNTVREQRMVTVLAVTEELVNKLCDEILSEIISSSYSTDDKIKAVWRWSRKNITYVGNSVSYTDELRVAYAAFATHSGDCYTYYISNKYLLNRLGIPNVEVRRIDSVTRHWWNLVQFSNGKWYHVDSSAHPVQLEKYTYKMTESDLLWFTEQFKSTTHPNYYEYDHTLPQYEGLNIAK